MKTFDIYIKRDGQSFKKHNYIYAETFEEAKKIFANDMTKDNFEKSNNIVWLTKENDGVETGFYDLDCSIVAFNEKTGEYDYSHKNTELEIFCLDKDIQEGFEYWNEDVYTWELRNN